MTDALETLYRLLVHRQHGEIAALPDYQWAREHWEEALDRFGTPEGGDKGDLKDAAGLVEYNWGCYSFGMGLDLGLSLSAELANSAPEA